MRNGFFLDSGASDGVQASNTRLLETSFGWSGICVEPNAELYDRLVRNRRCACLDCCLYDREGSIDFLEADTIGGIVQEYDPSLLRLARRRLRVADGAGLPTVPKTARTIRSVLDQYRAPAVIDYWSLDTEGSELALLRSFPFDVYSFRVLTVEHNWLPVRSEIRAFLENRGYVWVQEAGCDDCYVRNDIPLDAPPWRSHAWRRSPQPARRTSADGTKRPAR
ncbi:FkbM family methyltransferase [Streptomyces sp. ISL-43]|uniref:FkbM family methyltransferase n=1 Tax=Streptomyces sp. ISL-43 TaxID=2819183 RepID=UPI001BEAC837|nr:FkbM family methyltransferase [Streptomyces sp. ISL-43]MBT2449724.1 FkbM family methyltransferase [Streptomyces sp. ISL-43]